ncbi:MAG TPA: hypothetical protein VK689_17360 [Armatimonadota bacterium]|nr:hypothetical protein [Armatimonadota bacterium]
MNPSVEIHGHHGCRVAIEVLADEGSGWVRCRVAVVVSGFTAEYAASFDLPAFSRFHDELLAAYATLTGRASFVTIEETLELGVEMTPTGGAIVTGVARKQIPEVALTFEFDSDQTYLGLPCQQLAEILERHGASSVRGGSTGGRDVP